MALSSEDRSDHACEAAAVGPGRQKAQGFCISINVFTASRGLSTARVVPLCDQFVPLRKSQPWTSLSMKKRGGVSDQA
jgi:hypothetical protein